MKLEDTHKSLFRNLLLGGLVISILVGIIATVIEIRSIDNQLAEISYTEAEKTSSSYEKYYKLKTVEAYKELNDSIQKSLDHDLFIFIEFLDDSLKPVIQASIKDYETINGKLNKKFGTFKMKGKYECKTGYYNGQLYIKFMVPVISKTDNSVIGHFQGIYHLSNKQLKDIKLKSLISIIMTMVVVLITTILIYPIIFRLNKRLLNLSSDLLISNTNILKSLGSAIAERDSDTNSHNYRVTIYSVRLAEAIGCSPVQIRALIKGAFLHDVGKIGISDSILLKPGKLTDEEFETMKQHVSIGAKIVQNNEWLKHATDVIRYHHEKYDGSGYLTGLKGKDIPINAKIFAISDVFDALTSERPYKKPFSFEKSMDIMRKDVGKHFDPDLFNKFENIAEKLYTKIHAINDEEHLNQCMEDVMNDYFSISV